MLRKALRKLLRYGECNILLLLITLSCVGEIALWCRLPLLQFYCLGALLQLACLNNFTSHPNIQCVWVIAQDVFTNQQNKYKHTGIGSTWLVILTDAPYYYLTVNHRHSNIPWTRPGIGSIATPVYLCPTLFCSWLILSLCLFPSPLPAPSFYVLNPNSTPL